MWSDALQRVLNLGVDPKVAYALGGGHHNMSIGLKAFPSSSAAYGTNDSNAEGEATSTEPGDKDTAVPVSVPTSDAQVSWEFQVNASPYGGGLSCQYARDIFATGPEPPLRSHISEAGELFDRSSRAMTPKVARGVRLEIDTTVGFDLALGWTVKGTRRVGNFTHVGVGVGVQGSNGLIFSISWSRLGHAINLPVVVCPAEILSRNAVLWALAVPWGTYIAVDFGIVRPRARRKRKEEVASRRKELRRLVERRKAEASQAIRLMKDQVERRQRRERERDGLVILKAEYGSSNSGHTGAFASQSRNSRRQGEVADVTIAVAALVDSGQLVIPRQLSRVSVPDPSLL